MPVGKPVPGMGSGRELGAEADACMLGGTDGQTLFIAAAEWDDDAGMVAPDTGQLLAAPAPAPHSGRP